MIQKLHHKFVRVNLMLAALVLFIACVIACVVYGYVLKTATYNALEQAMINEDSRVINIYENPSYLIKVRYVPVAIMLVNQDGTIKEIMLDKGIDITSDILEQSAKKIVKRNSQNGTIEEFSLRYICKKQDDGFKIAIVNIDFEYKSMRNLMALLFIIWVFCMIAFWLISRSLFKEALAPVQDAWNKQRRFVADASHELKTPLTVMLANFSVLLSHPNDTINEQRKWLINSRDEALNMQKLVESLLILARSDAAIDLPEMKLVHLSDLLLNSALSFEAVAFDKDIKMNTQIAPNIYVKGDEQALKQLISILLDNAVKYAGKNGEINVKLFKHDVKYIIMQVQNSGKPIPANELPHIFERFYRGEQMRSTVNGHGLGLAIAHKIVQIHNGKITAQSSKTQGTKMQVVLQRIENPIINKIK
ncbi:MAG TPA: HAMP domain-containing histidine kinase [Candidatus Butyricicoccus avistercoris]|uniref:histidine kinase n=1 Tax=Candidatus Butyricicoccus avistercoris TaxID=2838518 RepID=A0A9D1PHZ1_9FIRM|nr:HAMP domain-containing histidine kinase [Candidatus Butyricicoccus avistercoris]